MSLSFVFSICLLHYRFNALHNKAGQKQFISNHTKKEKLNSMHLKENSMHLKTNFPFKEVQIIF